MVSVIPSAMGSGVAGRLVRSCILHISKAPEPLATQDNAGFKYSLSCEFGRFKLWAHGFDSTPRSSNENPKHISDQLDQVLDRSEYLKRPTMLLLSSFASYLLTRQFKGVGDAETSALVNNALKSAIETYPDLQDEFCELCSDQSQESVVEELREIVDSLFALALSLNDTLENLPASTDHKLQLTESQNICVTIIETYKSIIVAKFPNADPDVVLRIAEGNTECYERLRAQRAEAIMPIVAPDAEVPVDVPDNFLQADPVAPSNILSFRDSGLGPSCPSAFSLVLPPSVSPSTAFTSASAMGLKSSIPPIPQGIGSENRFTCPICSHIQARIFNKRQWRVHVFCDLRPYICIHTHCTATDKSFGSMREWLEHQNKHIQGDGIGSGAYACPFCLQEFTTAQKRFYAHLGRHMEDIRLFALPPSLRQFGDTVAFYDSSDTDVAVPTRGELSVIAEEPSASNSATGGLAQLKTYVLPDKERLVKDWLSSGHGTANLGMENAGLNMQEFVELAAPPVLELSPLHVFLVNLTPNDICREYEEIISNKSRKTGDPIRDFQIVARNALASPGVMTARQYEEMFEKGKGLNVPLPEVDLLGKIAAQLKWVDSVRESRVRFMSLDDTAELIKSGHELGIPSSNEEMIFLKSQKEGGDMQEAKAKELMKAEVVDFQQLEALSRQALPISRETLSLVDQILKKSREAHRLIISYHEQTKQPKLLQRPHYKDVKELLDSLIELRSRPVGMLDLEKELKRHENWMRRGKKLFGKTKAPLQALGQHLVYVEIRNKYCFCLEDRPRVPVEPSSREPSPQPEGDGPTGESLKSGRPREVFCICRRPEAGMMMECEVCHEWYHGKCVRIARGRVKEAEQYTCPICDYRVKILRYAARPKLEDLIDWHQETPNLPFIPDELDCLNNIIKAAKDFRVYLHPYTLSTLGLTSAEVPIIRFYLRKLEGAEILLAHETNFLRTELHRWMSIAPEPPAIEDSMPSQASTNEAVEVDGRGGGLQSR